MTQDASWRSSQYFFTVLGEVKFADIVLPDLDADLPLTWKSDTWEMRVKSNETTTQTKKGKNSPVTFKMI